MARVKSVNTSPEIAVRSMLHQMGLRFRLHRRDLPGTPDIVLPRHQIVVDVRGCFWHQHQSCEAAALPASNQKYWREKLAGNAARDARNALALRHLGWKQIVVWECETKSVEKLRTHLKKALLQKLIAESNNVSANVKQLIKVVLRIKHSH